MFPLFLRCLLAKNKNSGERMSFQAMAWAVSQKLPTRDKFVLLMLANYADENGMAWPSVSKLCDMTGMSRHTVIDAVKNLEKDKLIKAVRQTHQGVNLPNRYELQFAPVVQNLHHPVVQELHGGSAAVAPEPIIEPIIYNKPPCIPPKGKSARGSRLPPNWTPEGDYDREELEGFRDYWIAKAGKDGVKLDWQATWRNWLRNSKQWKRTQSIAKLSGGDPPFPEHGTIRYSSWDGKVRALGLGLDPDWIADQFRPWAKAKGIAFNGPDIGKAFMGFARAQKPI
jgi:Helix-turn-helix domain